MRDRLHDDWLSRTTGVPFGGFERFEPQFSITSRQPYIGSLVIPKTLTEPGAGEQVVLAVELLHNVTLK